MRAGMGIVVASNWKREDEERRIANERYIS